MNPSASEADHLAKKNSDRSRKVKRVGRSFLVPHKFSPDGSALTEESFNPARDLSQLSMTDFQLLDALQEHNWNMDKACAQLDIPREDAMRRFKRLKYFEFEAKRSKALASTATPDFVIAKHLDNVHTNTLDDGQRDSLKELAKILGAYKQTAINQTTIFNLPVLTPEQESQLRAIGDAIAMKQSAIAAEVIHENA